MSTPISHDEADKHLDAVAPRSQTAIGYLRQYVAEQREAEKKYENLLKAVLGILEAQETGMETIEERIDLARATAILQGTQTVAYLSFEDQCSIAEDDIEWDPAVDGELDEDATAPDDGDQEDDDDHDG